MIGARVLCCLLMMALPNAFGRMVYSADIVRHGARAPVHALDGEYHWPEAEGELLPIGFEELYKKGHRAKKRLISYHLLPKKNDSRAHLNQLLRVDSTDFNRTLMSAEAFTQGLYPASAIPIHTIPQGDDTLLLGFVPWHKKEIILLSQIDHTLDHLIAEAKQLCPAKLLGKDVLKDLFSAEDAIIMRHLAKRPYPEWVPKPCAQKMAVIFDRTWSDLYADQAMSRKVTARLLSTIHREAVRAASGKSSRRYHLFVGHDDDIAAVMSAFAKPLSAHPPIASVVSFAFYQKHKGSPLRVSMTFNGKPVTWSKCKSPCPVRMIWPASPPSPAPKTRSRPSLGKHQ